MRRFLIGSGFYKDPDFAKVWIENLERYVKDLRRVVVVSIGGASLPYVRTGLSEINLDGNCGHIGSILEGKKDHAISGWSASVCALAMTAYCDESDFVYVEDDCVAFGHWLDQMYADMGDGEMVFGPKHTSEPYMPCSQSLFLVRHRFIPTFVGMQLYLGDERHKDDDGKEDNLSEHKFVKMEKVFGESKIKRLSFGVDRCRPIPWDAPVFYFQKGTAEELDEARKRGLLK